MRNEAVSKSWTKKFIKNPMAGGPKTQKEKTMEKMRILVIDDTQKHLDAALLTLKGHDVTLCSSYDEAVVLLESKCDEEKLERLYKEYGGFETEGAFEKARKESALPYWDAVLCDLLMPAGKDAQGREGQQHVGQEMPVGWSLAMVAAMRGAKYVAVASDINHHDHPGSALLDRLDNSEGHIFSIDDAVVIMTNRLEFTCPQDEECSNCDMRKYGCNQESCQTARGGKDWGKLLDRLLAA